MTAASYRKMRPICARVVPSAVNTPTSRTRSTSDMDRVWKITNNPSTRASRPAKRTPLRKARSSAAWPMITLFLRS